MIYSGPERDRHQAPVDARLRSLHEISMELSRSPDVSALCRRAVELCISLLGFDRIGIFFIDPEDQRYLMGTWGTDEEGQARDEHDVRFERSFRHKRTELYMGLIPFVVVPGDVVLDQRSRPVGTSDKAIVPLWDGAGFVGELVADNLLSKRPIREEDGEILAILARTVAHLCALKRSETALKAALEAKALLLGELRHRTLNSFGMMRSLISLEAGRTADPEHASTLTKLKDRVSVLTSLYEQLDGSSEDGSVKLDEYLRRLAADLLSGYGAESRGVALVLEAEAVVIDMKRAVPLGLIVNELITDALKHAFPAGRGGTIRLELRRAGVEGSDLVLRVSDDGVGLPEGFDIGASQGFGIKLVEILRAQIGARLEIGPAGSGASFSLAFRL